MQQRTYESIRGSILPGDVIAFGGYGFVSRTIKKITRFPVSHCGVVLSTSVGSGISLVQIMESTSLGDGFAGVQVTRMSDRVRLYDGDLWWLPLSPENRESLDVTALTSFLLAQRGKEYDAPQAIGSAIDIIPDQREDLDKLFCSELVTAALEEASILNGINASEQTPADVCQFGIYSEASQIKGDPQELS